MQGAGGNANGGMNPGGAAAGGAPQGGAGPGGAGDCTCDGGQFCDPQLGCVECLLNTDCGGGNPICFLGSCEECGTNADCAMNEYCHPNSHICEPACMDSNDCGMGNANICDIPTGTCVECLTTDDCANQNAPLCNTTLGLCVNCITSNDCAGGDPVCDVPNGDCVECLFNSQCMPNQSCIGQSCN